MWWIFIVLWMKWCAIPKSGEVKNLKLIHIKFVPLDEQFQSSHVSLRIKNRKICRKNFCFLLVLHLFCFVFCFGFFETSAILAALLVKKFHVLFLFACFTVRSVGARITKVYLPAVIMKAQWLCGMLSLDQRPDLFRYPLPVLRIWDKNAFPPSPPPPRIINIINSVDNTKLSRYINDFQLWTISI